MPSFGEFNQKQHEIKQNFYKSVENFSFETEKSEKLVNKIESDKIHKIKDIIGLALDKIGPYQKLNNKEQVVAIIDEVNKHFFEIP